MSDGVIIGYITGQQLRHYRSELKSKKPSAKALCGAAPSASANWVQNLGDSHAEDRMEYPVCSDCVAALGAMNQS